MAKNDPTDTGGLFVGRRPGTAPLKYRAQPVTAGERRKNADRLLSAFILTVETLLCLTLWGPQPAGWLWVGSQVDYHTDNIGFAIVVAFAGMLTTLFMTLAVARRVDHAWKLVRRAAGHKQERGALERIFVIALIIVATAFWFWFIVLEGPGSSIVSPRAP